MVMLQSVLFFYLTMSGAPLLLIKKQNSFVLIIYAKYSKLLSTHCLPKRSRQTVQTQIRLLLRKQSDLGFPCLLF